MKDVAEIIKNFSLAGEIVDIESMNSDFYKDAEDTHWCRLKKLLKYLKK